MSHEVNVFWAAHVVHHQSEDYNLAVALRQSVTTSATVFPFYVVLAFLGVGPLQLGVANRVFMLENATYSVITPEGCASILWRSPDEARVAVVRRLEGRAGIGVPVVAHSLRDCRDARAAAACHPPATALAGAAIRRAAARFPRS